MNLPKTEEFEHKGKKFLIETSAVDSKFTVRVTLNGEQISPAYSVEFTTHFDYFMQYETSLVRQLVEIAKSDIKQGIYYRG